MADLLKHAAHHVCYSAELGRSALKDVGINTGDPQNWAAQEFRSLGMGGVADPKIHAPTCVTTSIGCTAIKSIRRNRKEPRKLGCWDTPLWDGAWLQAYYLK